MEKIIGHVADVENRKFRDAAVCFEDGKIIQISECKADDGAPYLLPGFIDSHIHIESTLLTPRNYAKLAVRHGTVAAVCDPHEIANVLGSEGIQYMMKSAESTPLKIAFGVPSSVPATTFETSGATLTAADTDRMLATHRFYGLAEVMNYPGVLMDEPTVKSKIASALTRGLLVDGHAPGLTGSQARKYISAGISTDHEIYELQTADERIRLGQKIQIREGSAARHLNSLLPLLKQQQNCGMLMLCTDDIYPDELTEGYINRIAAQAIAGGADFWNVIQAACITPVRHYGLKVGCLRQGDPADFILTRDLKNLTVLQTYINGKCVFGGNGDVFTCDEEGACPELVEGINRFNERNVTTQELQVKWSKGKIKVIEATEGMLYTGISLVEPRKGNDGMIQTDIVNDILKVVVVNRYKKVKASVGFIRGFGLTRGAIASTIAHDSHNIIAVGCSDQEIIRAIMALEKLHGGLCVADGSETLTLPLPVAGLMSTDSGEVVAKKHIQLKQKAKDIGCKFKAPFMTLAFMALPVIPELKITDMGLFDVKKFEFTPLTSNP